MQPGVDCRRSAESGVQPDSCAGADLLRRRPAKRPTSRAADPPARRRRSIAVWRFDGSRSARTPLGGRQTLGSLSANLSGAWRVTQWLDSLDPLTGLPVPVPITRNLFDVRADVTGPTCSSASSQTPNNGYAERFKHVIEPRVSVRYLSPFTRQTEVIQIDWQSTSSSAARRRVNYALDNRVLGEGADGRWRWTPSASCSPSASDRRYYTNAQASAVDPQYPPGFVGSSRRSGHRDGNAADDRCAGRFQMFIDSNRARRPSRTSATPALGDADVQLIGELVEDASSCRACRASTIPNAVSHAVNASTTVQHAVTGGWAAPTGSTWTFSTSRSSSSACDSLTTPSAAGSAVDYQMFNVSQFRRRACRQDRRFAVTFTLAGIGSFAPPLGAFGR